MCVHYVRRREAGFNKSLVCVFMTHQFSKNNMSRSRTETQEYEAAEKVGTNTDTQARRRTDTYAQLAIIIPSFLFCNRLFSCSYSHTYQLSGLGKFG